jgi:hypothetical protein
MKLIEGTERIAAKLGRWDPADVAFIRRITFENIEETTFDLALRLLLQPRTPGANGWPDPEGTFWEVEMAFDRVRDLVLTLTGPWDIQTPGFGMDDVRNHQWEGVNLLVYEYEKLTQERLCFRAWSSLVRSCELAALPPNSPHIWGEHPGVFGGDPE